MEKKEIIETLAKLYGTTPEAIEKLLNSPLGTFHDGVGFRGELRIVHRRKGVILSDETYKNLITNVGLEYYAKLILDLSANPMIYGALGTGTTAPANGDTTLEAEITTGGGERANMTESYEANYKAKLVHTWTFTASFSVTEFGVLDAASGGNLSVRHTFTAKAVESVDTLEMTHKLTCARG